MKNTPGTAGGPGGHDRTLDVKSKKIARKKLPKLNLNDGNNNGQATHGARKHARCTQAAWANISEMSFFMCSVTT